MILRVPPAHLQFTIPDGAQTLAGFRAWAASDEFPDGVGVSLLRGTLWIDMSPERIKAHNQAKAEIAAILYLLVKQANLGKFYPDGAWLTNGAVGLSTEPDATFASWEALETGRVELVVKSDAPGDGVELRRTPDWVIEVVSPSSVEKDADLLLGDFFHAGVRESWPIDASDADGFAAAAVEGWTGSTVFGRQFRLERQRDRLGGWEYILLVRKGRSQE